MHRTMGGLPATMVHSRATMTSIPKPIIIVTGSNGGVGFGICQRLLFQLCEAKPSDAYPQRFSSDPQDSQSFTPPKREGLTLILACRNQQRADAARTRLYDLLDRHIKNLERRPSFDGHAHKFRANLDIQVEIIDLASIKSVLSFADAISRKYPYISHLICNAAIVSYSRLSIPLFLYQAVTAFYDSITHPKYMFQNKGELSIDGLGWVWQCNVFGHYALFRAIQPLLEASPQGSRVIWSSSLTAAPHFYEIKKDWQLKYTDHSYESAKYQTDLLATCLDRHALRSVSPGANAVRHFISHPGVCSTNVNDAVTSPIQNFIKTLIFYLGRLCGSPHHPIVAYKAAIAAVHLCLVNLYFVTFWSTPEKGTIPPLATIDDYGSSPLKFGSETNRWGKERVGLTTVKKWETHEADGEDLLCKCETLFQALKEAEMGSMDSQ